MKFIDKDGNETVLNEGEALFVNPKGNVTVIPNTNHAVLLNEPSQDVSDFIKYACRYYGYTPKIANPDYDYDSVPSEENEMEIDNVTPDVFALRVLRSFSASLVNKGRDEDATNQALENKPLVNKIII